jgi:hypothetical protein
MPHEPERILAFLQPSCKTEASFGQCRLAVFLSLNHAGDIAHGSKGNTAANFGHVRFAPESGYRTWFKLRLAGR